MKMPTQAELLELLRYEPESGNLYWRARPRERFKHVQQWHYWNETYADKPAFEIITRGYKAGTLFKRRYLAHRIIHKMMFGTDAETIDHVNGDPSDNRLTNLRSVPHIENCHNQKRRNTNLSGCTGVCWVNHARRQSNWLAFIKVSGKLIYLGYHEEYDDAVAARKAGERKYNFHPNTDRVVA